MPIYEYECGTCGSVFEVMHSVNSKGPKSCETNGCKGKPKRLVSASGFILKGSGWYASDYPSEDRKKGWEKESSQANGGAKADAPASAPVAADGHTCGKETPKPAKPEAKADKAIKKAMNKNPYSGGKKKTKGSKA